jgi:hypothetical protein
MLPEILLSRNPETICSSGGRHARRTPRRTDSRSFRQFARFHHVIIPDRVFGAQTGHFEVRVKVDWRLSNPWYLGLP